MIEIKNLSKTFPSGSGGVEALKNVSLTIPDGEIYGIIGMSGAGKSTLVRCINMLERPTRGSVLIDGRDISLLSESELRKERRSITMIFQGFNLLMQRNCLKNVCFPLELAGAKKTQPEKRAAELLKIVGLEDKMKSYPAQLSGGQQQRVAIARALATDPKILLCDEATSALDPQTTRSILELIQDINRKLSLTVVVITHEMQVIKDICDKVAVIENGVIAEQGTVLDVFTNPQKPITKDFISVLLSNELPAAFRGGEVSKTPLPGAYLLLRLTFIGESADDPMLAGMIRKFPEIEVTMLFGNLDQIKSTPFGRMIIGITGPEAKIQEALQYLRQQDLKEEVIGYVRRHDSTSD